MKRSFLKKVKTIYPYAQPNIISKAIGTKKLFFQIIYFEKQASTIIVEYKNKLNSIQFYKKSCNHFDIIR